MWYNDAGRLSHTIKRFGERYRNPQPNFLHDELASEEIKYKAILFPKKMAHFYEY